MKISLTIILGIFLTGLVVSSAAADNQLTVEQLLNEAYQSRSVDHSKFKRAIEELSKRAQTLGLEERAFYKYLVGYDLAFSGKYEDAIVLYREAIAETDENSLKVKAGMSLINVLAILRRYNEGLLYLEETTLLLEDIEDQALERQGHIFTAIFYNQVGQYDLALAHAESINFSEAEPREQCFARQLRIEALLNLQRINVENADIGDAIEYCSDIGEHVVAGFVRTYEARLYISQSQFIEASDVLADSLRRVLATGYPRLVAEFYSLLAVSNWNLGRASLARKYAELSLGSDQSSTFSQPVVDSYQVLYRVAREEGAMQDALEYHEKYAEADKAYITDVTAKQLAYELAKHQADEKQRQIELLNSQNELLTLEKALDKKATQNNRLVIVLLALLTAFIIAWALRMRYNQNRFRRISQMDDLTGVNNRHHFVELSNGALVQGKRTDKECSLILLDMDHFKLINDTYGHPAGDKVLKHVMKICSDYARNNDIIGRLGGEEFAVLLPGCDIEKARYIAEQYRRKIAESDFSKQGYDFTISASLGVSSTRNSGYELKRLISDADVMMYAAKQRGRNQVAVMTEVLAADGAS